MNAATNEKTRSRGSPLLWLLIGTGSLTVTIVVLLFADFVPTTSSGTDAYSSSAIGYQALVELLETSDATTVVSTTTITETDGLGLVHLMLEPKLTTERQRLLFEDRLLESVLSDANVVVVLPKWLSRADYYKRGWVESVSQRPESEVEGVLAQVIMESPDSAGGSLVRLSGDPGEVSTTPWPDRVPELPYPQLIKEGYGGSESVLATSKGSLISYLGDGIYVISDPDLLNNAGLGKGDNAAIIHDFLVSHLKANRIVIDETVHGYVRAKSIWSELLDFPLNLVTLHFTFLMALVLWATVGRFGKPQTPPPRVPPGKEALIQNTADLLSLAGHPGHSLRRYFRLQVEEAARACGLPPGGDTEDRIKKLDSLSRVRGAAKGATQLRTSVHALADSTPDRGRILAVARTIHRWKDEVSLQKTQRGKV
jgi:hypothetical protein